MPMIVAAAAAWVGSAAVAVGASLTTALAIANATFTVLAFAAKVAVFAGVSRLLQKKSKLPSIAQVGTEVNVRDPVAPRQIIYGQRKVSGILYPVGVSGSKNEYLHLLLLAAGHECEELGTVYFNDEEVPLDGSGNATGRYAGYVRVLKHVGTHSQTVDTALQTDLGSTYWPNAMKGGGIAYLYIRLKLSQDLFAGGIPDFWVMVKGRKVYDPRAGGQSATDPSTWTWSENAALCLLDWVRGVPMKNGAGTLVRNFGLRASDAEIDLTAAGEAANICDETVGVEARYTANGVILTSAASGDGVEMLKSAMAGDFAYIGGKWVIRAGAYRMPYIEIKDADLRGPLMGVQIKPSRRELINGVKGLYISPDNAWQPSDFPAVTNSTYLTQDGGERLWRDIELPFTTSGATAQRLAKIIMERSRQAITLTAPCKLSALRNQVSDIVMLTHARFGWSYKPFEVIGFAFASENDENGNPYLGVNLTLRETSSGVYDWNNGEETTVDLAPNTDLPDALSVEQPTGLTLANSLLLQSDGTRIPRIAVSWIAPADQHVLSGGLIRVEYKLTSASDWSPAETMRGELTACFITAVAIGSGYDVRVRAENNIGVASQWTTALSITVAGDTSAPGAPQDLSAVAGTGRAVALAWTAPADADLSEFAVYRSTTGSSGTYVRIAEVSATRFVDVSVTLGQLYHYRVTAIDGSENESYPSGYVSVTPGAVGESDIDASIIADIADAMADASAAIAAAATAQGTADGKVTTFLGTSAPTAEGVGDLWIDTDDSNKLYRWSGTAWVAIRDAGIATALTNASNAQATADGKIVTYYQTSAPTQHSLGDLWVDTDDANRLYRWSGSAWVDVQGLKTDLPSNPSAASLASSTTYTAGDGTVYSRLVINVPSMPTGAILLNVLYRRNGAAGWIVADQRSSGGGTSAIDDLAPGGEYEVAVQAFSPFGYGSSIVTATSSPFTAPGKSTAPTAPASGGVSAAAATILGWDVSSIYFGARAYWSAVTDADFSHYEVKATGTDTDGATDAYWYGANSANSVSYITREIYFDFYRTTPTNGYVRVRSVNTSGVASAWVRLGNLSDVSAAMAGGAAKKNVGTAAGTVAAGDDSRITGAAQKSSNLSDLSSASSARTNLGLGTIATQAADNVNIDGGSVDGASSNGFVYTGTTGSARIAFGWDATNTRAGIWVDGALKIVIDQNV